MNLNTTWLGFELEHPLVAGASPMVRDLGTVRRLEDAGAAAIIMDSLFEEQLTQEQLATHAALEEPAESFGEALSYLPNVPHFELGPHEYLEQLRKVKQAVGIPVLGSLNGVTPGGWIEYADLIEQAGADALELNVYDLAISTEESSKAIEDRTVELVREVALSLRIPVSVKLSPFYTSLPNVAARLVDAGAKGLVLFNRFYQPDIDLEELEVVRLHLSDSSELPLRLHWLAILSGQVEASLAVTGGVHTGVDAIKAVMTGAHAVQMVSALLRNGPGYLRIVREQMVEWMREHEYESIRQMQGSMNLSRCPDRRAYERANYMKMLQSWRG